MVGGKRALPPSGPGLDFRDHDERQMDRSSHTRHTALRPIRPTLVSPEGKQPAGSQDPNPEQYPQLLSSRDRDPAQEATGQKPGPQWLQDEGTRL